MSASEKHLYRVPCTIGEERLVEVEARTADEAREKISAGRYKRLGQSVSRGFLIVGKPEVVKP